MQSKTHISDLLRTFGYSYEAIAFVSTNYERYLPAVATLCNLAAKVADESYYDLKDTMLDEMSSVADQMGWRTFESYDGATEGFPYIFYVDSGYFPQVSFHTDTPRPVNHRGKWSGISVQEIAPKLIANRLKKDGFVGEVYDLKLFTLNAMLGADVAEATHLHKGTEYNFVVNDNALLVLQNNIEVEPSKALLQSFMTRLAKQEKSLLKDESKNGSENSNELFSPNQKAETNDTHESGTSKATVKGLGEGVGKTTQKTEVSESEYDSSEEESSNEESNFTDADGITRMAGDEFGSNSKQDKNSFDAINNYSNSENADQSSQTGDLQSLNNESQLQDARELATVEDSVSDEAEAKKSFSLPNSSEKDGINPKEKATTAKQISGRGESQNDTSGFFDLLKSKDPKTQKDAGGGGAQLNVSRYSQSVQKNRLIEEALLRLASGESLSLKEDGYDRFDGRKVVKALTTSPHKLMNAKFKRPADKVYFFVDTSGSVAEFGNFIIQMIKSVKDAPTIEVWSGSEAYPHKNEKDVSKNTFQKKNSASYYNYTFEEAVKIWLKFAQPEIGSTLVFWGDAQMSVQNSFELLQITKYYNCIWLQVNDKNCRHLGETKKLEKAKFKVSYSVKDAKSFAKAIHNLV